MKAILIMFEYPIIVSDDEIKIGDKIADSDGVYEFNNKSSIIFLEKGGYKKVIASNNKEHNLPFINFNGLESSYGIFHWEKYWEEVNNQIKDVVNPYAYRLGFLKSQSINDKKFTLEDVKKAIKLARLMQDDESDEFDTESISGLTELCTYNLKDKYSTDKILDLIQQPKKFNIEVEHEDKIALDGHTVIGVEPTITDNSIKII